MALKGNRKGGKANNPVDCSPDAGRFPLGSPEKGRNQKMFLPSFIKITLYGIEKEECMNI